MITVVQAKNNHEVVEEFNPQVVVTWVASGGRSIDAFSRNLSHNYREFEDCLLAIPNTVRLASIHRYADGAFGFTKTNRVYVAGVVARANMMNNTVSVSAVKSILTAVADAMRQDGLTTIVLPNISTSRNAGLRTRSYLELIDSVMPDINVYVATAVPLESHGHQYVDISNTYVERPKIQVIKKTPSINSGFWNDNSKELKCPTDMLGYVVG